MTQTCEERATQPAQAITLDGTQTMPPSPFQRVGNRVSGTITAIAVGQYYDQRCVTITIANGGHSRTLYVAGSLRAALKAALRRAGCDRPEVGGQLWACYVRDGIARENQQHRPKYIAAAYTPPGAVPSRPRRREGDRSG